MLGMVPQPPTDNLYKFVALSGVAILIAGIVGPWSVSSTLVMEGFKHRAEDAVLDAELTELERLSSEGVAQTADLAARVERAKQDLSSRPEAFDTLAQEADYYKEKTGSWKLRNQELRLRNTRLLVEHEAYDYFAAQARLLTTLGIAVSLLGVAMAAWGFYQWYNLVQRHLDAELARSISAR